MKKDKAEKIIQKAERKAKKAELQVQAANKKAEAARQKQELQQQKKATKVADNATKKAAKKTKKAEAAAKKAKIATEKAEAKKAKAIAKVVKKAGGEGGPEVEAAEGAPKKGKKKLLLIIILVVAVAAGAGAFFFLRGDKEEEEVPPEPIEAPAEYVLNECHISALPVWGDVVVYQEEIKPEPVQPEEPEDGEAGEETEDGEEAEAEADTGTEEEDAFVKILYRYEGLQSPADLISAYTALMTTGDAGFSVVDETLLRIDPPEFGASGSVQIARNVPVSEDGSGGGVQSMLLAWDETNCSVTLDMPSGRVHDPVQETAAASARRGLSDLKEMHPSQLGLEGDSMDAYELIPQEGSVRIANSVCMRVNIYDANNQIAGSYFISNDGHLYKLDEAANAVVELDWE